MFQKVLLSSLAAVCLSLPGPATASADPEAGAPDTEPANVSDIGMLVDAQVNGRDVWSPGGRELHWTGAKCPYKVSFKGTVQVDKPTSVTYRWERSDGTQSPTLTFEVKKAGVLVEILPPDTWALGNPGQLFRGAETLHVLTPSDMSTTTPLRVECQ